MGGGGSETSTTSNTEPADWIEPYVKEFLKATQAEYNQQEEYYPGETVADYSSQTEDAMSRMWQSGTTKSDTTSAAESEYLKTLRGDYLAEGNPYLGKITDITSQRIGANLGDQFAASGGYMGSPGEVQSVAREVAEAMAPQYAASYEQERNRMSRSIGYADMFEAIEKGDLDKLMTVGGMRDVKAQQEIDAAREKWDWEQSKEERELEGYRKALSSLASYGAKTTQSSSAETDQTGTYVGAGAAVASALIVAVAI